VWSVTEDETYRKFTTQLFGMVGGMAFFTLVINGSTAGPLLKKLGLAKSTETRQKVLEIYKRDYKKHSYETFVSLLSDDRFAGLDFSRIRQRVEPLHVLSEDDLNAAINQSKENARSNYKEPKLSSVASGEGITNDPDVEKQADPSTSNNSGDRDKNVAQGFTSDRGDAVKPTSDKILEELRTIFTEQLKWAYRKQTESGDIDGRMPFLAYTIQEGLEFSADGVSYGKPLNDWETSQRISSKYLHHAERWGKKAHNFKRRVFKGRTRGDGAKSPEFQVVRFQVLLSMAMIGAHDVARETFEKEFSSRYPDEANTVLQESRDQTAKAEAKIAEYDTKDVDAVTEHLFCIMLLNRGSKYIEHLVSCGLLSEKEGQAALEKTEKLSEKLESDSKHD